MMRYNWYHCRHCHHEKPSRFTEFCSSGILAYSEVYAVVLGLIGSIMCAYDMKVIIRTGCSLPCNLSRIRKYLWGTISSHTYRDLKLAATAISLEYYLLLVLGGIIGSEVFLIPWLIFDGFCLVYECAATMLAIVNDNSTVSKPKCFLINMFMIYNWMIIFCACANMAGICRH